LGARLPAISFTKALRLSTIVDYAGAVARRMGGDMKAERKKTHQSKERERLWHASLRAEDNSVAHLHQFDPAVAFATACAVERTLAIEWEAEQEEMRRRRDPRKVMEIGSTRVRELDVALARLPQGVRPDPAAERHLLQIFKGLPPDRAWWVARTVVRYQDAQFDRSQLPADRERRADVSISEMEVPETIRRAAAGAWSDYREAQS
jgi:hypothetical protein